MVYRQTARSEKVRAASRGKILRAARRLFARTGYDQTSMRAVAVAAKTSVGNLYFYFKNKEEILTELLVESLREAWARGDAVAETVPAGPARLAVMVLCNFEGFLDRDRDLIQLLAEGTRHRHLGDMVVELTRERWTRYMTANAPQLIGDDLALAQVAWRGAARACVEAKLLGEITVPSESVAIFSVRWNLRAMGMPVEEIDAAIATALEAMPGRTVEMTPP